MKLRDRKWELNRLAILTVVGVAVCLAGCGSSSHSSAQPGSNQTFTVIASPSQMTLDAGDFATIAAIVEVSTNNGTPKPLSPQPAITFVSSDPRVTVSPTGEVCAGLWINQFQTCSPILVNGSPDLPPGFVTITITSPSKNATAATVLVSVHRHAARITLSSSPSVPPVSPQPWPTGKVCISQNNQVTYVAQAVDASGNVIPSCTTNPSDGGCIHDNDFVWSTDNSTVAGVSSFGSVLARNPGVTNVSATLNGTVSEPLAFATCPPEKIVLSTSPFSSDTPPTGPFMTADLSGDLSLNINDKKFVTASMIDRYGNPLVSSPLTFLSLNPLAGSFGSVLELSYPTPGGTPVTEPTAVLIANSAAGFSLLAACEPPSCNPAVGSFVTPNGPENGQTVGFGFPVYSNPIGATVQGSTGSQVLVTGQTLSDGVSPAHSLLVYDSESMSLVQTVVLANTPNSLMIAPNGAFAYVGSNNGLMVVNLGTLQPSLRTFPVSGQASTAVVSGAVLGVSQQGRYVVVFDPVSDANDPYATLFPNNSLLFLIDTTGTKTATLYPLAKNANITSVTFAADADAPNVNLGNGTKLWVGGSAGVYTFQSNTFVLTPTNQSTNVKSLAWMPDGQSYFASGDQLVNYSTCNSQHPLQPSPNLVWTGPAPLPVGVGQPLGLATTVLGGVPHLVGLDASQWFDYTVTSTAEVSEQTVPSITDLAPNGTGDICLSTVAVSAPVTAAAGLACTAQQLSFAQKLQQAFVTGVNADCTTSDSVIHGVNLSDHTPITLTLSATASPVVPLSGGVLNDGRKLYFGSFDTANGAILHRIDLATSTGAVGTRTEDDSVSVSVVPSYVAVVPK